MTEEELRVIAWTLLGEAGGEGSVGLEAVAHVIRNRAASGRFPANPAAVALQANSRGVHQFSAWNGLGNGGNAPRAQYPIGSAALTKAMAVVGKVFGATPGKDPTQGATHYYSPTGMTTGAAPYWWRSEARRGEKSIGRHIFAIKREDAVAPTPAKRSGGMDAPGAYPTNTSLEVLRSGRPAQLPAIGPTGGPSLRTAPKPAVMSQALQETTMRRVPSVGTTIYDPITKLEVRAMPSARDVIREARSEQQATRATPVSAKVAQVQRVAGFSVPGGIAGINAIDTVRARPTVSVSDKVRQAKTLPRVSASTSFASDDRLPETSRDVDFAGQSNGLSRDAVAARLAGREAVTVRPVVATPRVAATPVQQPRVAIVQPRPALEVLVSGANTVGRVIAAKPKAIDYTALVTAGKAAVAQSGDHSSGNQAEAAQARASGASWREAQARK